MVKSNKSSISSKKHEDRELAAKTAFEASNVEIQTPQTMILLLTSKEDMVVLKALASLDKYASRFEQNAQALCEAEILNPLLPLLDHQELYIRRFATKLLSELNFLPPVADVLLKEEFIPYMMEVLNNSTDFVVKEFSSSIVAELSKSNSGLAQLLKSELVHVLPAHLKVPDPDIQKNCLQGKTFRVFLQKKYKLEIISNLIQDSINHPLLTQEADFDIKTFIDLLMSEYVAIQNITLDILEILTRQTKGNTIPQDFQNAGGITRLLAILKNFEWKDIHSKCLDVLCNVYNNPNIAQNFLKDGIMQLFNYMKFINDPHLRKRAVDVIARIAETPLGRKTLAESGYIPELEAMLLEQSAGLAGAVSDAVSGLVQDHQALQLVMECDTISDLLAVVADETRDWNDKAPAVNALNQIMRRDENACSTVVESNKMDVIASVLSQYNEEVPTLAAVSAANCITNVANIPELRGKIVNKHLISSLLHCFEDFKEDTTPIKLSACEALCSLLSEKKARSLLRDLDGLPLVWASITKHPNNTQFLQAAANFVHLCIANDASFVRNLLQLDVVNWLLSQRSLRNECPAWEVALQTVLSKFLPLKFAMTGRLDLTDVTENGFYITRVGLSQEQLNKNQFPIIIDHIENKSCPSLTLYFANFTNVITKIDRQSEGSSILKTTSMSLPSLGSSSIVSVSSYDCNQFLLPDAYLQNYLNSLKSILEQNGFTNKDRTDSVIDGDTIRKKAMLIGQFVADQMIGVDETEVCTNHTLDLHINELKMEVKNNMIPVGSLRVGLHVERAFLFKVLADKLGLPASLVRGQHLQRAWVEVALPNIPPIPRPAYPNYLLKPNYVVDLLSSPVALYPLKSYEADVYCGLV